MKLIRLIVLFSFVILINPVIIHSQEENYDAVYLHLTKEFTLNPDGSMDYHYMKEMKLQTYRSFHNLYGETFIVYHPEFQSLKIKDVFTIMADGKKVASPSNAFNEVLPAFCANAPAYNTLREMVITHTGTERNAVINLDYTLHSNKDYYPALMGNELMAEYEPVRELVMRVRIPSTEKLNYRFINNETEPVISEEGQFRVYSWMMKNVPPISPEEFQKGGYELYPRLIFSTANDRDNVYGGFMKQGAFSYGVNSEMKKAVEEIRRDCKENVDVVLKLQEKVVNEFRLWSVPLRNVGFVCRTAAESWKSNGGTPIEKAVLLVALLKEAGIEAEPVLVVRNNLFDEKIGSLLDIDDILVKAILRENGPLFLSVSMLNPQSMSLSLSGKHLLSIKPNGKGTLEKPEELKNMLSMWGNFAINEKKQLSGDVSATFTNAVDPWFVMLRDQNKMKSYIGGGLASSDLKELKIITIGPAEAFARYSVQKEKPFLKDSNYYFYNLPFITNGIEGWGMKLLTQKREASLEIPLILDESYELSFILPPGLTLFSAEKKIEIVNETGSFVFEVKKNGKNISVTKRIRFTKRLIPTVEYAKFKALMDNWNSKRTREIVFVEE